MPIVNAAEKKDPDEAIRRQSPRRGRGSMSRRLMRERTPPKQDGPPHPAALTIAHVGLLF